MFNSHFFGGFPRKAGQQPQLGPEIGVVQGFPNTPFRESTLGQLGGPVYSPLKGSSNNSQSYLIVPPRPIEAKRDFASGKIGVRWIASLMDGSGYAEAGRNYVAALTTVGVDVVAQSVSFEEARSDYGRAGRLAQAAMVKVANYGINIAFLTPNLFPKYREPSCYNIGLFDWETDLLPTGWADACNIMDEIWVPCQWTADVAKKCGVKKPINIFGHCASPKDYLDGPVLQFPEIESTWYKFYSIFQWTERKNPGGLLRSYLKAFTDNDPVILILKTYRKNYSKGEQELIVSEIENIKDEVGGEHQPRLMALLGMMSKEEIQALHRAGDCFALIHRSEGWGLPHFEACMMGKPVITTGFSGNLEFTKPDNSYLVGYSPTKVSGMWMDYYNSNMIWAEPNIDECSKIMKHVFKNKAQAIQKGLQAKYYCQSKFSWEVMGLRIKERLAQISRKL